MRRRVFFVWAVSGIALVSAGCGQTLSPAPAVSPTPAPAASPTPSPLPSTPPATASKGLVHVLDRSHTSIVTYAADPATGQLSSVGQVTGPVPHHARLALHPSGRFLYHVAASSIETGKKVVVRAYRVEAPRGVLTPVGTFPSTYSLPAFVGDAAVTTDRLWVGTSGGTTGTHGALLAYDLNPSSGALVSRGPVSDLVEAHFVAAGPGGNNLYLGASPWPAYQPSLVTLRLDGSAITELFRLALPELPSGGAMYPFGRFLFLTVYDSDSSNLMTLRTFALSDGRPVERAAIRVPETRQVAVHPEGAFVGSAGPTGLRVHAFDASTGKLTLTDEIEMANGPRYLAWEPEGEFLYVSGPEGIRIFEFDRKRGTLGEIGQLSEGGGGLVASTLPVE